MFTFSRSIWEIIGSKTPRKKGIYNLIIFQLFYTTNFLSVQVEITVNGKVVDFPMKIGEAGEAFFVFETENHVPEELRTSPLAGPSRPSPTEEVSNVWFDS